MLTRVNTSVKKFVNDCENTVNTPSLFIFQHKINVFPKKNNNILYDSNFIKFNKKLYFGCIAENAYLSSKALDHAYSTHDNYNNYINNEYKYFTMLEQISSVQNPSLRSLINKMYLGLQIELNNHLHPEIFNFYKFHKLDKLETFFDKDTLDLFEFYLNNNLNTVAQFEKNMKKHLTFGKM